MNVLLLHPFSDISYARLQAGMPGASISRYASLADASPEALAQADILFASDSRRLPLPEQTPRLAWLQGYWAGIDHVIAGTAINGVTARTCVDGVVSCPTVQHRYLGAAGCD